MSRKRRWLKAITFWSMVVFVGAIVLANTAASAAEEPGTQSDPLVAKSYVDSRIASTRSYVDSALKSLKDRLEQLKSNPTRSQAELAVVELKAGQRIEADGGTELIVRSGKAVAVASELGGLSDVTEGVDRKQGETLPANHLLIVPRNDGRGLVAITDAFVLVRGNYTVDEVSGQP